jgi:hypothetical protein
MTTPQRRILSALVLLAWLTILAATPSFAQSRGYDGLWSVLIITERGTCDRGYRYPLRIARGRVGHADPASSSFTIRGSVGNGGTIRVSVSRGQDSANGAGRLSRSSGAGRWKTASGQCSGVWTAERRG